MMTSFAFILGLLPLVVAVGTRVFGGMLAASIFGIFMIPMLYVLFQTLRERVSGADQSSNRDLALEAKVQNEDAAAKAVGIASEGLG